MNTYRYFNGYMNEWVTVKADTVEFLPHGNVAFWKTSPDGSRFLVSTVTYQYWRSLHQVKEDEK